MGLFYLLLLNIHSLFIKKKKEEERKSDKPIALSLPQPQSLLPGI